MLQKMLLKCNMRPFFRCSDFERSSWKNLEPDPFAFHIEQLHASPLISPSTLKAMVPQ